MALDIVSKVRKLLDLSKNNPSREEAAAAAALAQEMMFRHQIGEADLDVASTDREIESVEEGVIHEEKKARRDVWKSSLANRLANAFGCRSYFSTYPTFQLHVVGTKSAVQTVQYTFKYLVLELTRLCEEAWEQNKDSVREHGKMWKNSFRLGAVHEIGTRLAKQQKEQAKVVAEKEAGGSTAIALYKSDQERTEEEYARIKRVHNLRSAPGSHVRSANAYVSGRAAGRSVSLGGGKELGASKGRIES